MDFWKIMEKIWFLGEYYIEWYSNNYKVNDFLYWKQYLHMYTVLRNKVRQRITLLNMPLVFKCVYPLESCNILLEEMDKCCELFSQQAVYKVMYTVSD